MENSTKKQRTYKCWGIPYGLRPSNQATTSITIESKAYSKKDFKEKCLNDEIKLTGKPYLA